MCLGAPGTIIETFAGATGVRMGRIGFAGVVRDACLEYVPDAAVGDYVFVHTGFAVSRLDEREAQRLIDLLGEIESAGELDTTLTE